MYLPGPAVRVNSAGMRPGDDRRGASRRSPADARGVERASM